MFAADFVEGLYVDGGGVVDDREVAFFGSTVFFNIFVVCEALAELLKLLIDNFFSDFCLGSFDFEPFVFRKLDFRCGDEFCFEGE